MAKAKSRRTTGRTPGRPRRAAATAKSKRSKKTARPRAKTARKTGSQTARTAPKRRPVAQKAAGTRQRKKAAPARRRVSAARKRTPKRAAATKVAARQKQAVSRKAVARKAVVRKAVASKPVASKPVARKVVARKVVAKPAPPTMKAAPPVVASPAARGARKAPAHGHGKLPALDRERRRLPEADVVPSPPSSLDLDRSASAARSGQAEIAEHLADHTETGPEITGGDVDASWESAYSTGDEAPGGDNPTPDQDVVDEIGLSLGLVYEEAEELQGANKITERDKHRWELDPASAEDFKER